MDSICKSRRKLAANSHQFSSFKDHFNLDKLDMERCLDDNEGLWLSSDFPSPSNFFAEHRLSEETFLDGLDPGNYEIHLGTSLELTSSVSDKEKTCSPNPEETLEDLDDDEPLFWPFELERCWNPEETWKSFTMSPRKDIEKLENTPGGTCKTHSKERHKRKAMMNSGSSNKNVRKLNNMPSRLRNSKKHSAKIVPLEIEDNIKEATSKNSYLFQDVLAMNQEVPIETFLGLGEFDGHEGVDSDVNVDAFFMEECL
ncbi:uncharacterized protein LOC123220897 [Mangifera indica]|uniref:uncharacterized protein LOC123207455 n=1 Tax=Mangifera indica TaxID=29780 RepID=UPI001CFC2A00|nr:uncharacterized protein LOC123207455 [Mangifera indica]XP_044481129.1 uncharacterized protein LOC123207740 [Mangifera indica]XP_044499434.1 uncharacterized protein LOC123220897 [Mangifera indica]